MEKVQLKRYLGSQLYYGFRKAFLKNEKLPLEARFIIVLLFTYKGKNKECWPSQGELAKRMNRDIDTVRKYLMILRQEGYLKIVSRGIGRSLLYTPSYMKISVGSLVEKNNSQEPVEIAKQEPIETPTQRSIVSKNKDNGLLIGKELFDKKRKELGLISKKPEVGNNT